MKEETWFTALHAIRAIVTNASTAALDHLTRSLAVEWGPDGIRVNGVLPWFTRTEMVKSALEDKAFERQLIEWNQASMQVIKIRKARLGIASVSGTG